MRGFFVLVCCLGLFAPNLFGPGSSAKIAASPRERETPEATSYDDAYKLIQGVYAKNGAPSAQELNKMANAVVAYSKRASKKQADLDRLVERAMQRLSRSLVASLYHHVQAEGVRSATQKLKDAGLISKNLADPIFTQCNQAAKGLNPSDKTAWASDTAKRAIAALVEAKKKMTDDQKKAPEEWAKLAKFEQQVRVLRMPGNTKKAQKLLADLMKFRGEVKAGKLDATQQINLGIGIGSLLVNLYRIWDAKDKEDLKKIRDSMREISEFLLLLQASAATAAPAKVVILTLLALLADLIDLGLDFGGGGNPPPGGGSDPGGNKGGKKDDMPPQKGEPKNPEGEGPAAVVKAPSKVPGGEAKGGEPKNVAEAADKAIGGLPDKLKGEDVKEKLEGIEKALQSQAKKANGKEPRQAEEKLVKEIMMMLREQLKEGKALTDGVVKKEDLRMALKRIWDRK